MRAGKAFSLVELLIGGALLGLLMTSIVAALYYCNRYLHSAESKIMAQAQCLQATMWISRSLADSSIKAVQVDPGVGVTFASPRTPSTGEVVFTGGNLMWQQTMAYYLTNNTNNVPILVHKGFPYNVPTPDPQAPMSVATAITTPSSQSRVVARYVRAMQIEVYQNVPANPPELRNSARIMIETFLPQYGLDYGVTVRTQVRLEN